MEESQGTLSDVPAIGGVIDGFIKHIDSLADTHPVTTKAIEEAIEQSSKETQALAERYIQLREENQNKAVFAAKLPRDMYQFTNQYLKLIRRTEKTLLAYNLVQRSFIISLISQFDAFLGNLIRALFLIQPESLNVSERSITFSQLQEFTSVDAAKEYIIEKEIDGVLRKSHPEQFDWLENKFGIKLRDGLKIWPTFIEVTERRNLFVHTSGVVTSQYINVCNKHNVDRSDNISIGLELVASSDYFREAYECVFEIGVKLAHILWRKVRPTEREIADRHLNSICYDLLVNEQFKLACILLDFATTSLRKYADEQRRRTFIINRAQAYKWIGDFETTQRIINSEDWSATNDAFKLARAVILGEFEEANKLVKKIGKGGDVSKNDYRTWPLFREYRNSQSFITTFEEVFEEPLQLMDTELENGLNELDNVTAEFSRLPSGLIDLQSIKILDIRNYTTEADDQSENEFTPSAQGKE